MRCALRVPELFLKCYNQLVTKVRNRLTLSYVGVLAAVLLVSWSLIALFLFWQLRGQVDHYAVQDIETIEGLLLFDAAGHLQLRDDYHNHPESKQVLERMLEVRDASGDVLFRNARLRGQALGDAPFAGEGIAGYSTRSGRLSDGTRVRLVSRRHTLDGHALLIRLAYSEEDIWARLRELAVSSLLALPLVLALAGFAGYALAKRALAPVEQSFEQLRRFTSDASHELRTPLASMRSVGEVGLQKDGTVAEYRDIIGSMLEEVNHLTSLVDNLLTIARADAGRLPLHPSEFGVMDLAREVAGLFEVLIQDKSQHLTIEGDESARIYGDRVFIRQALVNVVHNAMNYSPAGGTIRVGIYRDHGGVRLEVTDDGPGIDPAEAAKVFDRFYRVHDGRSRNTGGAGLGLSIAQWAISAHHGEIRLMNAPDAGCTVQISLPAAAG